MKICFFHFFLKSRLKALETLTYYLFFVKNKMLKLHIFKKSIFTVYMVMLYKDVFVQVYHAYFNSRAHYVAHADLELNLMSRLPGIYCHSWHA